MGLQDARINTAGAYICIDGYYVFAIGIQPHNGHIPVVRLGGHREEHETGWGCAVREVCEEANLHIQPLSPQRTYLCEWDQIDTELQEVQWQPNVEGEPIPILIVRYCREEKTYLSLMYLAEAEGVPKPSSEVKGLLLLGEEEVHRLCQESVTLEQYLRWGGRAIVNAEFDKRLVLEPFAQLRWLSRILILQRKQTL
jgi:8-oxo-dGTP pyrophosphatase MutT (NUDIX family)